MQIKFFKRKIRFLIGIPMLLIAGCQCTTTPQVPGVMYSTISARCGSDVHTVSTGSGSGNCVTGKGADGSVESVSCDDGKGNGASMSCKGGVGGCDKTSGSGTCVMKKD